MADLQARKRPKIDKRSQYTYGPTGMHNQQVIRGTPLNELQGSNKEVAEQGAHEASQSDPPIQPPAMGKRKRSLFGFGGYTRF